MLVERTNSANKGTGDPNISNKDKNACVRTKICQRSSRYRAAITRFKNAPPHNYMKCYEPFGWLDFPALQTCITKNPNEVLLVKFS